MTRRFIIIYSHSQNAHSCECVAATFLFLAADRMAMHQNSTWATYLPMVLMPLTPRFKHASLSLSIGVDIVGSRQNKRNTSHSQCLRYR